VIAVFLVRFCSLDVRSNRSSLKITWSYVCDRMVNSIDRIWLKFVEKDVVCRGHIIQSITLTVVGNRHYE